MITDISISNIATFQEEVSVKPKKVNYIYGTNGSGKTTLSNVLLSPKNYNSCKVNWELNTEIETLVYNRDFVENNFHQDKLKGIFTLGKDVPEIEEKISNLKKLKDNEEDKLKKEITSLSTVKNQKEELEKEFSNKCWEVKLKYDEKFRECFTGFIGSKDSLKQKCIKEQDNQLDLKDISHLEDKYNSLFKNELNIIDEKNIAQINIDDLIRLETDDIFKQSIIGKSESQIGELISYLGNSDWVKHGLDYLKHSQNKKCPFCQQVVEDSVRQEIENFFDQSYKEKCFILDKAGMAYLDYVKKIISQLKSNLDYDLKIFSFKKMPILLQAIEADFRANELNIEAKLKSKSQQIEVASLKNLFEEAMTEISECIAVIREHNNLVSNKKSERLVLINEVWKFLAHETKPIIDEYSKKIKGKNVGIQNIESKIKTISETISSKKREIEKMEASITSVSHSANEINRILEKFHFKGFHLAEADKGHYQIIRDDGSNAKETLSEGEFTFITFLYFFHLIRGSTDKSGTVENRIIVIDDPISSLDSNVLFIVSSLVKSIINECLNGSNIKQLFIMTHNVYFHKEITFKGSRDSSTKDETFWVIQKHNNQSQVKNFLKNPVKTTYELLWDEIRNPENINQVTIFNTLRRILEYYFKIIGNYPYESIVSQFDIADRCVCSSLISWINDGSHFVNDDIFVYTELESVERYKSIFRDIFIKLGHESHYNMMMNIECDDGSF